MEYVENISRILLGKRMDFFISPTTLNYEVSDNNLRFRTFTM